MFIFDHNYQHGSRTGLNLINKKSIMKNFYRLLGILSLSLLQLASQAQHTFSIVAIDPSTGEIGSAGATCLDNGASIISGLLPGKGAINAQSLVCTPENINLLNGLTWMDESLSPQAILDSLYANDQCGADDHEFRQYGVVTIDENGQIQAASFTGSKADDYANHIVGANYAIQGNILLGQEVLDEMEAGFIGTTGTLAEKLMAAMQGANMVGADARCAPNGTSSSGAFLRVACPTDLGNCPDVNLDVFFLPSGVEPIDELQTLYESYYTGNPFPAPTHDKCAFSAPITLASSEATCTPIDVEFAGAMESFVPLTFCDKDQTSSDVWYSFSTGTTLPLRGITIKADYGDLADDVSAAGFALYEGCNAFDYYVACKSSTNSVDSMLVPNACILPNTTYYLRVWSSESHLFENAQLRLCVYEENLPEFPTIVWGKNSGEGDFAFGLNDWVTVGLTADNHLWEWAPHGVNSSLISSFVLSQTTCNGAAGFNSTHYSTGGGFFDQFPTGNPPYPKFSGNLVSPSIDFSQIEDPTLHFTQHFGGLNGNDDTNVGNDETARGALFSYSTTAGLSWSEQVPINDDLDFNEYTSNYDQVSIPLPELAGMTDVRLKFTWDGDFYFWAIDDVYFTGISLIDTDVEQIEPNVDFYIYENPVGEQLNLQINAEQAFQGEIIIINALGQTISKQNIAVENELQQSLDVRALEAGMYFLKLKLDKDDFKVLKFMKL